MDGMQGMEEAFPRPSAPGIPCELASLVRVPLRFAKGRVET